MSVGVVEVGVFSQDAMLRTQNIMYRTILVYLCIDC